MILCINVRDKSLVCLDTKTIRTVSFIDNSNHNPFVNITMNLGFCIDNLKIYTESIDECRQIYDRIIYCVNNPIEAVTFSKEYLRIGFDDMEGSSYDQC